MLLGIVKIEPGQERMISSVELRLSEGSCFLPSSDNTIRTEPVTPYLEWWSWYVR